MGIARRRRRAFGERMSIDEASPLDVISSWVYVVLIGSWLVHSALGAKAMQSKPDEPGTVVRPLADLEGRSEKLKRRQDRGRLDSAEPHGVLTDTPRRNAGVQIDWWNSCEPNRLRIQLQLSYRRRRR